MAPSIFFQVFLFYIDILVVSLLSNILLSISFMKRLYIFVIYDGLRAVILIKLENTNVMLPSIKKSTQVRKQRL